MKEAERSARVLHKVLTVDNEKPFIPCRKPEQNNLYPEIDDPFLDKWANPFFIRGVPKNEKELKESVTQRKALFALPTDPTHKWYAATSGNKSTTRANDVFDVVADADITGGVTQRQLGRSGRFGVAPSADNRGLPGSTLPAPPLKDTKVLYGPDGVHHRATLTSGSTLLTVSNKSRSQNVSQTDIIPSTKSSKYVIYA